MRSIIVTGASSGIGAALAQLAVERGWNVLAVARRTEGLAQLHGAKTLALDVTTRDAHLRIIDAAVQAFGQIDVVVNNAGVAAPGTLLQQSDAAIDAQWQLHVAAPLRIARAALPQLEKHRGGLVFLGSGLARVPAPGYGAYASAKAAVRAAAIQLRRELRAIGVFVTYVDPGVVDTNFSHASGMQPDPAWWHATPQHVAARILRGIERRATRVNAVNWQTAGTVFGEWFPSIADAAMASLVTPPTASAALVPDDTPPPSVTMDTQLEPFDAALEPLQRRMERVKLSEAFLRELLVPNTEISLHDAAMRWAGMPNKNERAALHEVLNALSDAGFLTSVGEERWKVLRAPSSA